MLWCFARQCDPETITKALGLSVRDLFPPGHCRAARRRPRSVRRTDFQGPALTVTNVLYALEQLDEPWTLMVTSTCPGCGHPGAWLRASASGAADADCPDGCDVHKYVQALLGRLDDAKEKTDGR